MYFSILIRIFYILFLFACSHASAQNGRGDEVFQFLRLPLSPQLAALGDYNISNISPDPGLSSLNPSLLRKEMDGKASLVFRSGVAGLKNLNLLYAGHSSRMNTNFNFSVQYFNYGSTNETDFAGNITGIFHPVDYAIQAGFSRQYEKRWFYGAGLKFIYSNYSIYKSSGLAIDAGINYYDSTSGFQAGLLFKNMGFQLKAYAGSDKSILPFDLIIGLSKKFKNAPVQFSVTGHSLHNFSLLKEYHIANNEENTIEEILSHIVWAVQLYAGKYIEVSAGYNHLGRIEQGVIPYNKGFTGISFGVGVLLPRLQLRYSTGAYQPGSTRHYFGIGVNLKEML